MPKAALAIVAQELERRRWYLVWWSVGIVILVGLTVLAYGSVKDQAAQLEKAFGDLSSSVGSFFGTSDMFSPVGYLNSQLYFITLPILFILLSVTLSSSLISKEERRGTLELLLARPIKRAHLLLAKALAGALVIALLGIVTTIVTIVCSFIVDIDVATGHIALATLWMVLFSCAFGAVAFMLYAASSVTRRIAVVAAIFLSFGGYILTSLSGMVSGLSWVAKLFPYHYYDPGALLTGNVSAGLMVYTTILYVASVVIALVGFGRRDIG